MLINDTEGRLAVPPRISGGRLSKVSYVGVLLVAPGTEFIARNMTQAQT